MKIISGGQTGADRGALTAAYFCGIETGGFAPKYFMTENGEDESLKIFGLEDSGLGYAGRTNLNAQSADITLWFGRNDTAGYKATKNAAQRWNVFVNCTSKSVEEIATIISNFNIINIAGNRESKSPGIQKKVYDTMVAVFLYKKQRTL
jgi:hypothetical protein